jgi:hypothetical protein
MRVDKSWPVKDCSSEISNGMRVNWILPSATKISWTLLKIWTSWTLMRVLKWANITHSKVRKIFDLQTLWLKSISYNVNTVLTYFAISFDMAFFPPPKPNTLIGISGRWKFGNIKVNWKVCYGHYQAPIYAISLYVVKWISILIMCGVHCVLWTF